MVLSTRWLFNFEGRVFKKRREDDDVPYLTTVFVSRLRNVILHMTIAESYNSVPIPKYRSWVSKLKILVEAAWETRRSPVFMFLFSLP